MPKDNINCVVVDSLRAELSWRPDPGDGTGHVQLATVHTDSPATMPREKQQDDDQPGSVQLDGWHITLDRDGINRLIRGLRRARDAAFGTDA